MPSRSAHLRFDEYLREHGVIHEYSFAETVHDRMDRDLTYWGPGHREIDFYLSRQLASVHNLLDC